VVQEEVIDTSPPVLHVTLSPLPFTPDGDGVDDEMSVNINIETKSDIYAWHIQIREPRPPYLLFSEWRGEGMPPETIVWNGISTSGELVQSASDYPFTLAVNNIYGEEAYFTGNVEVGILVVREGNIRRIIVPSIVFAANAGNFAGLDADTTAANDFILRRVAEALERYPDNKVKVEGHANPTTAPGTRARTDEETGTRTVKGLRPLSEERAKAVLDYLVGLGIDPERLSAVGMGSARTIVDFADRDNWWKNRRVEFILED
jgi:outer membrane protein OmpA-like peptidoglycan-associated protein